MCAISLPSKRLQGAVDARLRARRRVLQVPGNAADAVPCERLRPKHPLFLLPHEKETLPAMKRICLVSMFLLLWTAAAAGQPAGSGYITDSFQVTLRTGPGADHKIVGMLHSGQALTLLDEEEQGQEWRRVELPDGKQGYVLARFISSSPPARLELEKLRSAYDELQTRAARLEAENDRLVSENGTFKSQLEEARAELSKVRGKYTTLRSESADFFALKNRYERAAASLKKSTERVDKLEAEVARLQVNRNIRWFLSGAGVLVLGFLIGFSAKKQRRRSSLL